MKRFLVEEGAGNDVRLWKLAQSLSALETPAEVDKPVPPPTKPVVKERHPWIYLWNIRRQRELAGAP